MKPKYTDLTKYPNGYVTAAKTDVRKTFNRIREEQKEAAAKEKRRVDETVTPIKRGVK